MRLPYLNNINNLKISPLLFSGINKKEIINDNEISDGHNLSTDEIPAICPREPMEVIKSLVKPNYLGVINNKLVYVDGTSFYYDNQLKGTVSDTKKSIVDFNGYIVIFPDKKYYDYINNEFNSFTCPDIDYAVVHYNRIFGIKGSEIRASKLGDFKAWEQFEGTQMDSWGTDVYSVGDFTGTVSYQDHIVFYKENSMYELYGYTPSQFKVLEVAKIGCIDNKSITETQGILFFASETGIFVYTGGFPTDISTNLNIKNLNKASLIGNGNKVYISIDGTTYIYDTNLKTFLPYADLDVLYFAKDDMYVYALTTDGEIYRLNSGDEIVEWSLTTKQFDDGVFNKKSIKAIRLKAIMETGSEMSIYVSRDNRPFIQVGQTIKFQNEYIKTKEVKITIPLKRASYYQIKITGKGKSIIYGEKEFVVGSDK